MKVNRPQSRHQRCGRFLPRCLLAWVIAVCFFIGCVDLRADKAVSVYTGPTGSGKQVTHGCVYVLFDMIGFTGTIGGASFSNVTHTIPIPASQDGTTLSAIPYTVTSGTLVIVEVR